MERHEDETFDPLKLQMELAELAVNVHRSAALNHQRQAQRYLDKFNATGCLKAFVAYTAISEEQMRAEAIAERFNAALERAA